MQLNFPNVKIVRASEDNSLKIVRRGLNQHPTFYVVILGRVVHQGNYKWCLERFNSYLEAGEAYIEYQ